uniref:GT23 domain-containing protein n=1 Tax=Guillardia theta TaxID=55529 RepID=A0A7S4U7I8_GUITH|mmetsp:Transcript_48936/g.153683  ORF Transcript_48936/g.153683 Transcript_48936/m.153683 type:complete len:418 (+) Transcript_48936:173-1426(+)
MTPLSSCSFIPPLLALFVVIRVAGADERCGNGWLEYADLHERIITGKDAQRYVYFRPDRWRGYSNQLLGISSMFALALVTDRAFMIEPSQFTRMFYSPHIRWNASLSHDTEIRYVDDMKDCDANAALDALMMADLYSLYPESVLSISTNVLWWPSLFRNPRLAHRVEQWGLADPDAFFGCAMKYLFHPSKELQQALEPLLEQIRGKYTVGMHLRLNPMNGQARVEDMNSYVECGRDILAMNGREWNDTDVRWIVATDLPDIIPDLQQALGTRQLVWYDAPQDDGTGVSDVATQEEREEEDAFALKRAVDHYLLSMSNETIITFASTYGLAAAHFQPEKRHHYNYGRHYHQPNMSPACELRTCSLSQPCFNKAFGYFGLCDSDIIYSHGVDFLDSMDQMYDFSSKPLRLPSQCSKTDM